MTFNILHAIPVYAPAWKFGGPVQSVSRLCEGLVLKGHSVHVITTNAGLKDFPEMQLGASTVRNGVKVTYYQVDFDKGIIRSSALKRDLHSVLKDIDLVHLSAMWQPIGIPIQKLAWEKGIPVIHSLRGALSPYSRSQHWWKKLPYYYLKERIWLQRAAALHVTTLQEAHELHDLKLRAPLWVLPNPIDLHQFKPTPNLVNTFHAQLNIKSDVPTLLICGRQHHKKGLDLLSGVLSSVRDLRWQLLIVGGDDDGSGARLIRELEESGLKSRISQFGVLPSNELSQIYNIADLLLLPSRHENFGNVVIEAMACGCGVMISESTGVSEDIKQSAPHNFGAILPREEEIWSLWLRHWLMNPQRPGLIAAEWVQKYYGIDSITSQTIDFYRQTIETHPRS